MNERISNSIREKVGDMNFSSPVSILPCRITKINRDNLTVDVYLQETSALIKNVPICFPSKGKGYGSYFMPKENSTYLLLYSNKRKPYILASAPISVNLESPSFTEKLMPGENTTQSYGNAYIRQDIIGNNILSSQFGNANIQDANGVNRSSSLGYQSNTIGTKNINGLSLTQNAYLDREYLNYNTLKVFDYYECYSQIEINKTYNPDEIITYNGDDATIDLVIRQDIISATKDCLDKIELFKNAVLTQKNIIKTMSLTDLELAAAITQAYAIMKDFNIVRKGVKIVTEKGNALNRRPNNISDVTSFRSVDFAQRNGIDIVYRTTIEDAVTGVVKGKVTIDADGNCDLKFKSLNLDIETFTSTIPIGGSGIFPDVAPADGIIDVANRMSLHGVTIEPQDVVDLELNKADKPDVRNFVVTTRIQANEVITFSTGNGAALGRSTPSGDTVLLPTSSALMISDNSCKILLDGFEVIKGQDFIWDSQTTGHFTFILDAGDTFKIEVTSIEVVIPPVVPIDFDVSPDIAPTDGIIDVANRITLNGVTIEPQDVVDLELYKADKPNVRNFVVTARFEANEVITFLTGNGSALGRSTPSGDTVLLPVSSALMITDNSCRILLDGFELMKGDEFIWVSQTTGYFPFILDVGDTFKIESTTV